MSALILIFVSKESDKDVKGENEKKTNPEEVNEDQASKAEGDKDDEEKLECKSTSSVIFS